MQGISGKQNPRLTRGVSAGTRSALCSWLLTSGPTPICLCKPFSCKACPGIEPDDTNWIVRGYRILRKMLPAIRELPFLNMEAFDGIPVTIMTEGDQTQVIKPPEGTELFYIWTLSGRASLQWGEG